MKGFIEGLGGTGRAAFTALSIVFTAGFALDLPYFVDTANPWVLVGAGSIVFVLAFANGWKQRGFKNQRDIELADRLERERVEEVDRLERDRVELG